MSADFVAAMEDVLDVYAEPLNPSVPVVCFDETPHQLIGEVRTPLPPHPGQSERHDYEYQRHGTCNVFLCFEPLRGWRHLEVTAQRTHVEFAQQMKWLVDEAYPEAERIRVVLDNLNIHKGASLYRTFAPSEARRILKRLEFHYTPKHGSWLNMAELEFAVFTRECWDRRIAEKETFRYETQTLTDERNARRATVHWHFTAHTARETLVHLYPSVTN